MWTLLLLLACGLGPFVVDEPSADDAEAVSESTNDTFHPEDMGGPWGDARDLPPPPPPVKDPRTFGPRPPIPERDRSFDPRRDTVLDPAHAFPLDEADVIAIARVVEIEDICDTSSFHDRARQDPFCNRQVVTLEVEHGLKGVDEGARLLVLKLHNRLAIAVGGPTWEGWTTHVGSLRLLMLQPENEFGIREPVYTRALVHSVAAHRASWVVNTPFGMSRPLLVSPLRTYFRCSDTELVFMSPYSVRSRAQRALVAPDREPAKGESPMTAYERDVNAGLKSAWADHSCEPEALAELIRGALAAMGGGR